ncbi:hypothetical protein [uncultured Rikenella sp.]|nr:hypothetical protein [uncultured Rikenella sp.]
MVCNPVIYFVATKLQRAFPAPGFRDAGNDGRLGDLLYIGNSGFCYSSSMSGSNGVYLTFTVASLYHSDAGHRAYGLQLRCLSE